MRPKASPLGDGLHVQAGELDGFASYCVVIGFLRGQPINLGVQLEPSLASRMPGRAQDEMDSPI